MSNPNDRDLAAEALEAANEEEQVFREKMFQDPGFSGPQLAQAESLYNQVYRFVEVFIGSSFLDKLEYALLLPEDGGDPGEAGFVISLDVLSHRLEFSYDWVESEVPGVAGRWENAKNW